jgi:hypothetical protein
VFVGSLDFVQPIESEVDRNYTFDFYTFINCQNESCAAAGDYIALGLREIGEPIDEIIFRRNSSGRNLDKKWMKESVSYYLKSEIRYYVRLYNLKFSF